MSTPDPNIDAGARKRLMPVLFVAVFMAALDTAVVGPTIPTLRATYGVDHRAVALVTTVYVLFSLVSTALMANLSDRRGRRPVFLASVGIFALGSLLVAVAPSFWMIVAARAIQGIGAGGITPAASAIVGDIYPPDDRGKALGLIGATFGMAFVVGPPLAAFLMMVANWHWIFLVNLPIAAFVIWRGATALPAQRAAAAPAPLDVAGLVLLFGVLLALMLGITRFADPFVGVMLWPACLAAAALLAAAFVALERRVARPVIPMTLFTHRQLAITYTLTVGAGFGMGSVVFLATIATLAHGIDADKAGFALLPLVVASMVGAAGGGRLMNHVGPRSLMVAGFAFLAIGYLGTAFTQLGLVPFLVASLPVGLGVGIVVGGSLRSIAIDEAPAADRTAAQGVINLGTAIGTLTAAAAVSAIADFAGGGAEGFGRAYLVVAALMAAMIPLSLALRPTQLAARAAA